MLARLEAHGNPLRHAQPEYVLGIVRDARRVTVAPYGIDFVHVLQVPVLERVAGGVDAGFLEDLPDRRVAQGLALVLAAGDRLPEAGMIGALQQQHLERGRVDHHQRRDRNLHRPLQPTRMRATTSESPSKKAWGMSRVRWAATVEPWRSTAMKPTSASKERPSWSRSARIAPASVSPCSTLSESARVARVRITNSPVPVAEA